jgi:tetratricopeptide (TPR) repeat protein
MPNTPEFDLNKAHKYFSADCFNKAWELIEKHDRTSEEDEHMLRLSMASAWHWTQREDRQPKNMSIAYWQIARIYALLQQAENARRYGQMCLDVSLGEDIPPFYLGYAYEALARAEMVAGDHEQTQHYLEDAHHAADRVKDAESKAMLLADLETIV